MADGKRAAPSAAEQELLKEKYAELRMATRQIKQLEQQLEAIGEKKQELEAAGESLNDLKKAEKNTKLLTPISEGMFVSATLENNTELVVNVGSNVCVKKTVDEAKAMLRDRQQELLNMQEAMLEELNKLTDQATTLESELGQLLKE